MLQQLDKFILPPKFKYIYIYIYIYIKLSLSTNFRKRKYAIFNQNFHFKLFLKIQRSSNKIKIGFQTFQPKSGNCCNFRVILGPVCVYIYMIRNRGKILRISQQVYYIVNVLFHVVFNH